MKGKKKDQRPKKENVGPRIKGIVSINSKGTGYLKNPAAPKD
jgi:hypothetical protein